MGTRRSWAIAFAAIAITAFVIGAVMWRASAPPRALGRHAIYITDVTTGATTLWRSAPDRDLWAPDWSPDGTMIAWHETAADNVPADLMVANRDGSGAHRVAAGSHASWSPGGRSLAFEGQIEQADNSHLRHRPRDPGDPPPDDSSALDWTPSWCRTADDRVHVPAHRLDQLSPSKRMGRRRSERWRPERIFRPPCLVSRWVADRLGSDRAADAEIYVAQPDGTQVVSLTDNTVADWDPVWSPDGRQIVFLSYRDGPADLYTMEANGTHQTRLTRDPVMEDTGGFDWSPDSASIIHAAAIRERD
jgi:hypothetical protein